jgi:hypothetical protein
MTSTNKKLPARRVRLDGKPPGLPKGRHADPVSKGEHERPEATPLPLPSRLGYRIGEFAALTGTSPAHIWRGIKDKKIKTVELHGVTLIPRAFAVELGFIKETDSI